MFLGHRKPWEFGPREGWHGAGDTEVIRRLGLYASQSPPTTAGREGKGPEWRGQNHPRGGSDGDVCQHGGDTVGATGRK